jgi:hypothetical protein
MVTLSTNFGLNSNAILFVLIFTNNRKQTEKYRCKRLLPAWVEMLSYFDLYVYSGYRKKGI